MKRLYKITAVTLVTALFIMCFSSGASAATEYGVYGQGGFDPPYDWAYIRDNQIMFLPLDVASNGEYLGYYFLLPRSNGMYGRIIYTDNENNSNGKFGYYLQLYCNSEKSFDMSTSLQKWRSDVRTLRSVTPSWTKYSGSWYNACYLICYSDNLYLDDDFVYHAYVIDSESNYNHIFDTCPFLRSPGSGVYIVPKPLRSTDSGWALNYGYETEEEKNQAVEQSRFDEQNKIMKEGFTVLENSINNMGNKIEGAITQAVDDILNAGSDKPSLDTDNEWMNDSLTKVNEWLSTIEEFDKQMDAAEEENAENMANAKTFLTSFFSKIPKGIIAVLTLALVMIVAVKVVGR